MVEGQEIWSTYACTYIPSFKYIRMYAYISMYVPSHSPGVTHSFIASSITVPGGHSHPSMIQIRGQIVGVRLHVG